MGLLSVPSSYTPRHNGKKYPKEKPYLLSAKEVRGVLAATDGKANKTPYKGVKSLFMETTGGVKGGTTGIGTKTGGGSTAGKTGTGDRGTPGMNQGSNSVRGGSGNQGTQGSNGGTGDRGTPGMNQGSNSVHGGPVGQDPRSSAMNSYSGQSISQPSARTPSDAQLSRAIGGLLGNPNSMPGNSNPNLNYGQGTPGNPVAGLNNRNPMLGNTDPNVQYGAGTVTHMDPSVPGRAQQATTNALAQQGVPGGYGMPGYEPGLSRPAPPVAMDPQFAGRLAATRAPGYGVPTGFPGDKEFSDRLAQDSTATGQITANGIPGFSTAYMNKPPAPQKQFTASLTPGVANPSVFNANYPQAARNNLSAGQVLNNQTINDAVHPGSMLNASRVPAAPTGGVTAGPETPVGPAGWQQGSNIDPSAGAPEEQDDGSGVMSVAGDFLKNTPAGRAAKGIMNVLDTLSGNKAYRNDVSLGTDVSGRRTDRAPSAGSSGFGPGSFGPGGGDRGGGNSAKGNTNQTPVLPVVPPVAPPSPVNPMTAWMYPQYQSQWAGLPVGVGGYARG